MQLKKGIPVSPGIVIRDAFVMNTEEIRIPQRFVEKEIVEEEAERFLAGLTAAVDRLDGEIDRLGTRLSISTQILEIHKQLISDPVLKEEILTSIRDHQYTAEHAVSRVLNRYIKKFQGMDSPIIQERIHDLFDVERLILNTLLGSRMETLHTLSKEVIVIASNLTPAQAAQLDPRWVKGFATDVGGKTSHTAIIARALAIPAVVALEDISTQVLGGDKVIIDGFRGVVIVNPDPSTLNEYREKEKDALRFFRRLRRITNFPCESIDGHAVDLQANIELVQEIHTATELGASGVGLFRTEYIHFLSPRPDEELHFQNYRQVLRELGDHPITIRTLDLGGDKMEEGRAGPAEDNPFLGNRSIRYCLNHPEVFVPQLRAILRVSTLGKVRLMFPMVTSVLELDRALVLLDEVRSDLRREGVPFDEEMPVGVMVEVPALALIADRVAARVDFFSIGTNDLVQYTLAVDRGNPHVAALYDPLHPAVLRLLAQTLEAGENAGIDVTLCGEMGSEPVYLPLLLGLGLRRLSVGPQLIPEVKQVVRSMEIHSVRALAAECMAKDDGREIEEHLRNWARVNLPETPLRY